MADAKNPAPSADPPVAAAPPPRPPLSGGRLAVAALLGLGVLGTVFVGMWFWINTTPATGEQKTTAHLDVFKTTSSVAVMLGGTGALYLAARRQRTQEAEHAHAVRFAEINRQHAERVAAATEDDAARRRVTELYTKAADQLGSDKAPVRLAGLYALERLGQDNPDQRETIAHLWCAYLRMPYNPPRPMAARRPGGVARPLHINPRRRTSIQRPDPAAATPTDPAAAHAEAVLERDVRVSVQRLLAKHLRPRPGDNGQPHHDYWPEIPDLDLTEATLINLDLSGCRIGTVLLEGATFHGVAQFTRATFHGDARFAGATFHGYAAFTATDFHGDAWFDSATFRATVLFDRATFRGDAAFDRGTFSKYAGFIDTNIHATARFEQATFHGDARFDRAVFSGLTCQGAARFDGTTFNGPTRFDSAAFGEMATFDEVTFHADVSFNGATFEDGVPENISDAAGSP